MLEFFPIPIKVFNRDGDVIFVNQAVLEMWNILNSSQMVGKLNIRNDYLVNEDLGLKNYVEHTFKGELVVVPDVMVPLEDFAKKYKARSFNYDIRIMYTDILNFPLADKNGDFNYIVSVFLTTRIYKGNIDTAKAKEYIDNHWQEEFDINKIAKNIHLSTSQLTRLFKNDTGMTPYSYYQSIKINKLREALCNKNLSISQAFSACGLEYHGNYAKLFKKCVGMTPTEYKKAFTSNIEY